ncbi:MAG: pyrrolo-quinoline quinone [Thermoanaerobaculales bacterium]
MTQTHRAVARPTSISSDRLCAAVPRILSCLGMAGLSCVAAMAQGILTYHADNRRTGWTANETVLTPTLVQATTFGKLFTHDVDGAIYGQPLVVPGVMLAGGSIHDLVLVATQYDSVYAFDAESVTGANAAPLWHTSFLDEGAPGVVVQPVTPWFVACDDISPEIGITSTPAVDLAGGTVWVVAKTMETSNAGVSFVQRLHALDLASGQEKPGSPVVITAAVPGTAADAGPDGLIHFDPLRHLNRPGLLLLGGVVYIAFGSHCDVTPYHGWLLAYDASSLAQLGAVCITPAGSEGSIWMSGGAPAADDAGDLFLVTSNGTFNLDKSGADASDSLLKIAPVPGGMRILDSFTPFDQEMLNDGDVDLGSGGIMLLADQPSGPPHLAICGGKEGTLYLLDRDDLGGYQPTSDKVVQSLPGALAGLYSTPAQFRDLVFVADSDSAGGHLHAFQMVPGHGLAPATVPAAAHYFPFPGAGLAVSSAGLQGGVLWALEHATPAVLHAYDATDLSRELYSSEQAGSRDEPGSGVKFAVPTIWNGRVYIGTMERLAVYGGLPPRRVRQKLVPLH